jgi:hypothetical protein
MEINKKLINVKVEIFFLLPHYFQAFSPFVYVYAFWIIFLSMISERKVNELLIVVEWQEAIKGISFPTKQKKAYIARDENWKWYKKRAFHQIAFKLSTQQQSL